jgi:hypothetical protein
MAHMVYLVGCENCPATFPILETNLRGIVRGPRGSHTGEPALMLVCQACKTPSLYQFRPLGGVATTTEPIPDELREPPICVCVYAECGKCNSEARVQLLAIRPAGTTREDVLAEAGEWKLESLRCRNGHAISLPGRQD